MIIYVDGQEHLCQKLIGLISEKLFGEKVYKD